MQRSTFTFLNDQADGDQSGDVVGKGRCGNAYFTLDMTNRRACVSRFDQQTKNRQSGFIAQFSQNSCRFVLFHTGKIGRLARDVNDNSRIMEIYITTINPLSQWKQSKFSHGKESIRSQMRTLRLWRIREFPAILDGLQNDIPRDRYGFRIWRYANFERRPTAPKKLPHGVIVAMRGALELVVGDIVFPVRQIPARLKNA